MILHDIILLITNINLLLIKKKGDKFTIHELITLKTNV